MTHADHSAMSILTRACDPATAQHAAQAIPPCIGNPEYVAATSDDDFINQLRSREWSVVFFAPGACRFSARGAAIPGGNEKTAGWSLDQYRTLAKRTQGEHVQIVEAMHEAETIELLAAALTQARTTNPK